MMHRLVLAIVLTWSTVSAADPKEDARAHVVVADTHFKLGRFEQALEQYTKAYELFPVPALLFNLGQCHRSLRQWERAIFFFKGYLREAPNAPNRAIVEDLIRENELAAREEAAARTAEESAARAAAQEQVKLEAQRRNEERLRAEKETRTDDAVRDARKTPERAPLYRKWWFWTAVGGAALATGGTAYYFSRSTTVDPTGSLGGLDRR
ncbi:MAG: tetratricopeptide repeat protein [Kofleriaceae bacterium]